MTPPAAERGSATITVSAAAALLLLLIAVIAGAVGGITGQEASACTAVMASGMLRGRVIRVLGNGLPNRVPLIARSDAVVRHVST